MNKLIQLATEGDDGGTMNHWPYRMTRVLLAASFVVLVGSVGIPMADAGTTPSVTICHLPPGNPSNVQLITVGAAAVPKHVANHGDAICAAGDSDCCAAQDGEVCTNLQDDPENCGACGHPCPSDSTCDGGTCSPSVTCPTIGVNTALCRSWSQNGACVATCLNNAASCMNVNCNNPTQAAACAAELNTLDDCGDICCGAP
jgi:hypothetical protein